MDRLSALDISTITVILLIFCSKSFTYTSLLTFSTLKGLIFDMIQFFSLVKMSLIFTAIIALLSRVQSDETDFGYIFNRDRKEWDL